MIRAKGLGLVICAVALSLFGMEATGAKRWEKAREKEVKTYGFSDFVGVSNSLRCEVEITQGSLYAVIAESKYAGMLSDVQVEVRNGILTVDASEEVRRALEDMGRKERFTLRVTMPRLMVLKLYGSGAISVKSDLQSDGLTIDVGGSGVVAARKVTSVGKVGVSLAGSGEIETGALEAAEVELNVSGSGRLKVGGVSVGGEMKLQHTGSGLLAVGKMDCQKMSLAYSGSGKLSAGGVSAKEFVDLQCGGSGGVEVGMVKASRVAVQSNGSGSVDVSGVKAEKLDLQQSAVGLVKVGGGSSRMGSVEVTGSGNVDMAKHSYREVDLSVLGTGNVSLRVTREARVKTTASAPSISLDGGAKVLLNWSVK